MLTSHFVRMFAHLIPTSTVLLYSPLLWASWEVLHKVHILHIIVIQSLQCWLQSATFYFSIKANVTLVIKPALIIVYFTEFNKNKS